jgi:SAM-dependent methyltransferase
MHRCTQPRAPGRGPGTRSPGASSVSPRPLHALPADVAGLDVVELGCGTGYFGAWLARRGAHVTGIDNSAEQLKTARGLQDEHDLHFPLIHRNAEDTGLPDASFDLALSEYGAAIWADPYRWIPEAARILRPGGELIFLGNGTFWVLTVPETNDEGPATDRLLGRTSGCIASTGPASPASSSTSGTAIGSGYCEPAASRFSTCSRGAAWRRARLGGHALSLSARRSCRSR